MFENRALRAFAPKGDEVAGGWRGLQNEDLQVLFKENEMGWACRTKKEKRNAYVISVKARMKETARKSKT
jgi:hypothetical protein